MWITPNKVFFLKKSNEAETRVGTILILTDRTGQMKLPQIKAWNSEKRQAAVWTVLEFWFEAPVRYQEEDE